MRELSACENKCTEQAIPISPQDEVICSEEDFDEFDVNGMETDREPESQKENSKSCEQLTNKTESGKTI